MKIDQIFLVTFSDFLINISAGWFAAGIITIPKSKRSRRFKISVLTTNLLFAIIVFVVAYALRKII